MVTAAPTPALIRAQVAAVCQDLRPDARGVAIAIHSPAAWAGEKQLSVAGETFPIRTCDSTLELREALLDAESLGSPLVVITPLRDEDIEADVRARLARRRLQRIRPFEVVLDALELRGIDGRLTAEPWMAERLLEARATLGEPVLPSGFLDADTAWDLVAVSLGLPDGRPGAIELLRWAEEGGRATFLALDQATVLGLSRRVRETAGPVGEAILASLSSAGDGDATSLGLVLGILFHPDPPEEARLGLGQAAARLERYCGHRALTANAARTWADAAGALVEEWLRRSDPTQLRPWLQRADILLEEVGAAEHAHLGRWSLVGFEDRLGCLASMLDSAASMPDEGSMSRVTKALGEVRNHGLAEAHRDRVLRCEMATRVLRWLSGPTSDAGSFEEAASRYVAETGYVDWIRTALEAGDGSEALSRAFTGLLSRVAQRREAENARFGALLANWVAAGGSLEDALRVEDVLSRVVAPLAEHAPVLLLVVDGMSLAVYRQVAEDLVREGWIEMAQEGASGPRVVIAALPTVTQVSRTSLLVGRLRSGAAPDEKAGFESHVELTRVCGKRRPPLLFHKADLVDVTEAGLSSAARAALADPDRRVVGVVVNAVDDHLAKGDQIRPRWGIEVIAPLRTVLHAAQQADRIIIVTSDHGHVPERGTEVRSHPDGERWRRASEGAPESGEILVAGSRVQLAGGRVIVPWTERLRYGGKKNGYHGGVSPQEVVVPLAVFSPGVELGGWVEVGTVWPSWWADEVSVAGPRPRALRRRTRAPDQGSLFEKARSEGVAPRPEWLDPLLRSPVWKEQLRRAGRVSSELDRFRKALELLDERGGSLTRQALGARLELPAVRIGGFVTALRRVLNVEGYDVLRFDEPSDTLVLDRDLLRRQFELPRGSTG